MKHTESLSLRGRLRIIIPETQKVLVDETNLIVYNGRESLLVFLLKRPNPAIQPQPNWGLYWWGLGSGGLVNPTDPTTRIIPSPEDMTLGNHLNLFDTTVPGTTSDGRFRTHTTVDYLQDVVHGNRQLIAALSLRVHKQEFNGVFINEAGLFLSNSPDPSVASSFVLFSKISFNSIAKENSFSLLFQWFLYS